MCQRVAVILTVGFVGLALIEYGERPLKLVLKVSGNEVTTGSSSRDTFYDEQSADLDKPKEKKKKKKRDKERNLRSPVDDRGKKKVMPFCFLYFKTVFKKRRLLTCFPLI